MAVRKGTWSSGVEVISCSLEEIPCLLLHAGSSSTPAAMEKEGKCEGRINEDGEEGAISVVGSLSMRAPDCLSTLS